MQFTFRNGLRTAANSPPVYGPVEAANVGTVAFLGGDFPGVVFDLRVAEGDQVATGQTICVDRHRPEIEFVAPAAGQVTRIQLGARRRLVSLEISRQDETNREFGGFADAKGHTKLRELLLKSGAWTSFRTRPYGYVPGPADRPQGIFVTATDTNPMAPDPVSVLTPQISLFQRGTEALLHLTDGPVYICQPDGAPLVSETDRLRTATFSGAHPAGVAGTHIHHLMPASRQRSIWQIGYQDVVAIGYLLDTGRIMARRTVSIGGAGLSNPLLVEAPLGAKLAELAPDLTNSGTWQWLSGSILSGQASEYLHRHDLQATVLGQERDDNLTRPFWHRLFDSLPALQTGATLPLESYERAFPFGLLPVPLMRALAVGDVEASERLGCLELLEEDLALLSHLCPSGSDYGLLLRRTLDVLAEEQTA